MRHTMTAAWAEKVCLEELFAGEVISHRATVSPEEEWAVHGGGKIFGGFGREESRV